MLEDKDDQIFELIQEVDKLKEEESHSEKKISRPYSKAN